jgi:hypothetical protein
MGMFILSLNQQVTLAVAVAEIVGPKAVANSLLQAK